MYCYLQRTECIFSISWKIKYCSVKCIVHLKACKYFLWHLRTLDKDVGVESKGNVVNLKKIPAMTSQQNNPTKNSHPPLIYSTILSVFAYKIQQQC